MTVAKSAAQRVPRYLQVAAALRRRLRAGEWPVGARLPTVAALQTEFDVARVTVRQAIELLVQEGLLRSHQGKGTFVTRADGAERWLRLAADWRGLVDPIRDNVPRRLAVRGTPPAPLIEAADGTPAASYAYLRSVQRRGREPFALASVHVADAVYRRAPREYGTRIALAVLLEREAGAIAAARMSFTVGAAGVAAHRHLRLPLDAPTLEARCVVTDRAGVVLYVGEFVYPADVVRFDVALAAPAGG
jgi:GntR family transcriptional regulator